MSEKKEKTAAKVGIESRLLVFPESLSEKELLDKISELNDDPSVHGILVQAPCPPTWMTVECSIMFLQIKMWMVLMPQTLVCFARKMTMHLPHALPPESLNFLKEPRLTPRESM